MRGVIEQALGATCLVSLSIMVWSLPARASTPEHVQFLLIQRLCRACDLRELDLSGLDLSDVNLKGALLTGADLTGSRLSGADLSGAQLQGANLAGVNLDGANLTNANLTNANLTQATFKDAKLNNTQLSGTRLQRSPVLLSRQIDYSRASASFPQNRNNTPPNYVASSSVAPRVPRVIDSSHQQPESISPSRSQGYSSLSPNHQPTSTPSQDYPLFIGGAETPETKATPLRHAGIGFIDGSTVPKNQFLISQFGGEQGFLSSLRYGIRHDLEAFAYIDQITSDVDESIQGVGVKYQFLNQDRGQPLTAGLAVNVGLTNRAFLNFQSNDSSALAAQGLDANIAFLGNGENSAEGERYIVGVAAPLHFQMDERVNVWLTPIANLVSGSGFEQAGVNLGASVKVHPNVELVAEAGANFLGDGNAFEGGSLTDAIPWNAGIRLNSANLKGFGNGPTDPQLVLDLYVTNRVGNSPWNQLRVREENQTAIGAGLSFLY